jgi:TonB family protein
MIVVRKLGWVALMAMIGAAGGTKSITQIEAMRAVVARVPPEYPALAKQLKISGTVELDVTIGENGAVETVTPISGNPVLTKPAAEALKKWKFTPFSQDGTPVKARAPIKLNFSN